MKAPPVVKPARDGRRASGRKRKRRARPRPASTTKVFVFRLFVSGSTPRSIKAIRAMKDFCEKYLDGSYDLEVVDIYQQPRRAREEQIIAAPTLVKKDPVPLQKFIGDLSDLRKLMALVGTRQPGE